MNKNDFNLIKFNYLDKLIERMFKNAKKISYSMTFKNMHKHFRIIDWEDVFP